MSANYVVDSFVVRAVHSLHSLFCFSSAFHSVGYDCCDGLRGSQHRISTQQNTVVKVIVVVVIVVVVVVIVVVFAAVAEVVVVVVAVVAAAAVAEAVVVFVAVVVVAQPSTSSPFNP